MTRIAKETARLCSTLRGEINYLSEFLKESGALLDVKNTPRVKLTDKDQAELKRLMDMLQEADDGKQQNGSMRIESKAVGDLIISFAKPIKKQSILAEMAAIYAVTLLEAHVKDLFRVVLLAREEMLRSTRQFTAAEMLGFKKRSELVAFLADRDVDDLGYGSIDDIASTFQKKMNIDFRAFEDWSAVRELCYRRNLLVHNQGVTNQKFCALSGHTKPGQKLHTDLPYAERAAELVQKFSDFVSTALVKKFAERKKQPN